VGSLIVNSATSIRQKLIATNDPVLSQCVNCSMGVKDARSVSLYPYNRSQILQYVKHTK